MSRVNSKYAVREKFAFLGPGEICRTGDRLLADLEGGGSRSLLFSVCVATLISAMCYGFVFGVWRSIEQAIYSAVKMPGLIFSVATGSALINGMLARVLGAKLSFRQSYMLVMLSFCITSLLLAGLAPVMFYIQFQCPSSGAGNAMLSYRWLLPLHTAVIGVCGVAGNARLFGLLVRLTGCRAVAKRVMAGWIMVAGLLGCQLSWLISPFLARPDLPVPFFNPNAFAGNFFEYLFLALRGMLAD